MALTMISFRMEEELKKHMEIVCQELGLSMTTAFTVFAKKLVREQGIPFEISATATKGASKDMTIDEQMTVVVNELADIFGTEHIISRAELISIVHERFQTSPGSIIPSDYCYNRINNGITLKKPTLLNFLGSGNYQCLGDNYCFDGPIYHRPKGESTDIVVGHCVDGERILDEEFLNGLNRR